MTDGSVPVLADTYSLLVTGLSAVRLPRSALSVSMIASVSGSMTEMVPGPRFIAYTRPLRGSMVRFLTLAPVLSVTTGPATPLTILTMPRSGNAAYALPLRVLTTTPLGPSVTPTSALIAVARPRSAAASAIAGRREVVCRVTGMRRILLAIGCLAATLLTPPSLVAQQPQAARPKVLAFFTPGGYAFAATSDWDALNDVNLRDVRVVIWLNDMPHTSAQRLAFERFVAGGGGWLGFHVSGFGTNAWPWFTEFMGGGRFSANNWPSMPARVNADDLAHPILKGVPATFVAPISEWYSWTPSPRANPDVKILLTLDGSNFPLGVKNTLNGGDIPVAWINTKYRMVYVNYGHGDRIYSAPPLPTMIDNILRWLLSR